MENVTAYLYDAEGSDREIEILDLDVSGLNDDQILWVVISERNEEILSRVVDHIGIDGAPCKLMISEDSSPRLEKYEKFFHLSINAVAVGSHGSPHSLKVDFLVGKNFVITVSSGEPEFFKEFRDREKGESMIGELDAESIVASLLDQNVVEYFRCLNRLESRIDAIDETILKKDIDTDKFLEEMVKLRSDASKLRRWLMPHREVYFALSRPDFKQIAESTAAEHYLQLNQHFESAVSAVEHAREVVIGLFDLYATKTSHMMNLLIKRLTFLTLITGTLAVFAGIFGMNFKSELFEIENGFWITVVGLTVLGIAITVYAMIKRWI